MESELDAIAVEWAERARAGIPEDRALTGLALLDHVPSLLAELVDWLRSGSADASARFDGTAVAHALQRLGEEIDVRAVVEEYALLREVVHERFEGSCEGSDVADLRRFNQAIDRAIQEAVTRYVGQRDARRVAQAERLQLALDAGRLATWDYDVERQTVSLDARGRTLLGLEPARAEHAAGDLRSLVHPSDLAVVDAALRAASAGNGDVEATLRVVLGAPRAMRSLQVRCRVASRTAGGAPQRVVGTLADVSAQRRVEHDRDALVRIASAALDTTDLDRFLARLLSVFVEAQEHVDTAAILLREGETLRVHAAKGLDSADRQTVKIGEGFAGTIAATRRPLHLSDAASSPLVSGPWVRERGIRSLYGVPLVFRGEVYGVAHVGSRTTSELPADDRALFGALAQRATSAIAKHILHRNAARRGAELEAVLRAIPDAVVVGGPERIVLANEPAAALLGCEPNEVQGAPARVVDDVVLLEPVTRARIRSPEHPYARALRGERTVARLLRPTGDDERILRVAAVPLPPGDDDQPSAVMVASDVTELVRLERHRETLAHAIVHDVRNPLTALRGICRIAADALEKHAEAALVTRLRSVDESVARVDRLLSDLLDVTLAETGRMHLSLHPVDVRHLIEDVASAWAAASHGHTLRAEGPRVVACADADRVRQVLENLVGNAIKYSPKGGPVLLRCEREGTRALVVVEDCGPGVPEQERRTIFDPYVRARSARAAAAGHGLGLFVASQLVRAHGGSIGVRPVDPHGASFWFTLPLAEGEAAE